MSAYDHSKVTAFIGMCTTCVPLRDVVIQGTLFIGGNTLDKAPTGRVSDFVKENGGHTVITKVRQGFWSPRTNFHFSTPDSHCKQWSVGAYL